MFSLIIPQVSPILWLVMIIFIMFLYLFISFNVYFYNNKNFVNKSLIIKFKSLSWW